MRERLRESQSERESQKEEKARLEVVVRMLEAEVKEVSEIGVGKDFFLN